MIRKKIWIDLDNSPHVVFFRPIIAELRLRGHDLFITARDAYQVCDLAARFHVACKRIGRHYGKRKTMKVAGLLLRCAQLATAAAGKSLALAVSHGSRSQLIVAKTLGVKSILILDYEYTQDVPFVRPDWVFCPEVIPIEKIGINGKRPRVFKYPGIKEDVYVPSFQPDPSILAELGLDPSQLIVTVRPPATEAHYHNPKSEELFDATLKFLGGQEGIQSIVLPRNHRQEEDIKRHWANLILSKRLIIPPGAIDGLNLIWHSDIVISGGGTMNREAAALGVPVYSIFRGHIGAVDQYLAETGRLVLLETARDVVQRIHLVKRDWSQCGHTFRNDVFLKVVEKIISIADGKE